jgi:hypothetical protein
MPTMAIAILLASIHFSGSAEQGLFLFQAPGISTVRLMGQKRQAFSI